MLKRYFVEIQYNGQNYHGWQIQPNAISVQGVLNENISKLLGNQPIKSTGCGRTDTGVHATQFFLHFDTEHQFEPDDFCYNLNKMLPDDIYVKGARLVDTDLHTRFSAKRRRYHYYVSKHKLPFEIGLYYHFKKELDLSAMNECCSTLLIHSDFTSFSKVKSSSVTNICEIIEAKWYEENGKIVFTIQADRFLRNMVRALVGTMLEVGQGKMTVADFVEIIKSKDRKKAGTSAPASGLFLSEIIY